MKQQSIGGAHYEPLYKIGLHFGTRFWERSSVNPCFGGQSTTDLRFRWIVYPSNDLGNSSGVLLTYSWMNDAAKWSRLSRSERIKICLHDLSKYMQIRLISISTSNSLRPLTSRGRPNHAAEMLCFSQVNFHASSK